MMHSFFLPAFVFIFLSSGALANHLQIDIVVPSKFSTKVNKLINFASTAFFRDCMLQLEISKTELETIVPSDFKIDEAGETLRIHHKWMSDFLLNYQRPNNNIPLIVFIEVNELDKNNYNIGIAHTIKTLKYETGGWITQEQAELLKNVVFINSKYLRNRNKGTLAHELGHLLGQEHVVVRENLMYLFSGKGRKIFDANQCEQMNELVTKGQIRYQANH